MRTTFAASRGISVSLTRPLEEPPLRWHRAIEKLRSTYDLEAIKATLGSVETLAMTSTALRDAAALGFDRAGVVETIAGIERDVL